MSLTLKHAGEPAICRSPGISVLGHRWSESSHSRQSEVPLRDDTVSSQTPPLKLIPLLLNVFEVFEDDFLDFTPIA